MSINTFSVDAHGRAKSAYKQVFGKILLIPFQVRNPQTCPFCLKEGAGNKHPPHNTPPSDSYPQGWENWFKDGLGPFHEPEGNDWDE